MRRARSISDDRNATAPARARFGPWSLERYRESVSTGPGFVRNYSGSPSPNLILVASTQEGTKSQWNVRSGWEVPVTSKIKVAF